MEDIAAAFYPLMYSLTQLIVVIASSRYLKRKKNKIGALLFYGSLVVLISGILSYLFSHIMNKFIEIDPLIIGFTFGAMSFISLIGLICFAVGFYDLIKNSLIQENTKSNSIEKH